MPNRDPYLDNLKIILVFCVVTTHFFFEYRNSATMMAAFNAMCVFIMPVFIFISGYLSRHIRGQRPKDIVILLVPYFILEILNLIFTKSTHLGYGNKSLLIPTYQNWYLLSLFFWRLIIPYFRALKSQYAILIAFSMSFLSGFVPQLGEFLSLYRTFFYLPVFVLGFYSNDIRSIVSDKLIHKWIAGIIFFGFLISIAFVSYSNTHKAEDIFYAYLPNSGYTNDLSSIILRNIALISSILCAYCFMHIIPGRHLRITALGRNTMYIYLFHMFLVLPIIKVSGEYGAGKTEIIIILSSICISLLLSSNAVCSLLKWVIYPSIPDRIKSKIQS